jgi:hypothetical protein
MKEREPDRPEALRRYCPDSHSKGKSMRLFPSRSVIGALGKGSVPLLFSAAASLCSAQLPAGYPGKPWHDSVQTLPGLLQPEDYDEGAAGVTWFDTDPHVGAYTARNSGVDLDPVHAGDPTVPGSTVKAVPGDVYWGWLVNNEWLKMTVDVKRAGAYAISALVGTAMTNTSFKVDALQGADSVSSGALVLPFTGSCPVECYHYWFFAKDLGHIQLKAGLQVIRLQIVKSGYNLEYVDLEPDGTSGLMDSGRKTARPTGRVRTEEPAKEFDASGRNRKDAKAPRFSSVRGGLRE